MRILVMFDLPTNTPAQRKDATKFRNFLLKDGYHMIQYSVYSRVCAGNDDVEKHANRLQQNIPSEGSVRMITLTEKQYVSQKIFLGKSNRDDEMHGGKIEFF
mgnify:CR=1 FL=1